MQRLRCPARHPLAQQRCSLLQNHNVCRPKPDMVLAATLQLHPVSALECMQLSCLCAQIALIDVTGDALNCSIYRVVGLLVRHMTKRLAAGTDGADFNDFDVFNDMFLGATSEPGVTAFRKDTEALGVSPAQRPAKTGQHHPLSGVSSLLSL